MDDDPYTGRVGEPMSKPEDAYLLSVRLAGLPEPHPEYCGIPGRKYRFDFAWPALMLAVEIEGGQYVNGRHNRPAGYAEDCEKYNLAALEGWVVLRFTPKMVTDGIAVALTETMIERINS